MSLAHTFDTVGKGRPYGHVMPLSLWLLVLLLANLAILMLQIVLGEYPVPWRDALRHIVGVSSADAYQELVVWRFRFPRALVAMLAGMALAVSGVILQGITRNPLGSPGVLGLNAGAALSTVGAMVLLPAVPAAALPLTAFVGAALAAMIAYGLAWRRGLSSTRLVLIGVSISAAAGALVSLLLTISDLHDARRALIWMSGSVYGRSWEHFWPLLPWVALLVPLAWRCARQLDVLQFGDPQALGLGLPLERSRALLLGISIALAAAAVSMAGTVGFVGLMAPHIARYLVGPTTRRLLPTAAGIGALMVNAADLLGRTIMMPIEIPCGILIALIGAPYLIFLLYQKRNHAY